MRLLEAVAREGSITAGARAVGLTYKAAWDAIAAMSRLFGVPLLETHAGGRAGGGAALTPAGARLIGAFRRLELELARLVRDVEADLAGVRIAAFDPPSRPLVKTSARNALRGTVAGLRRGALTSEVSLVLPGGPILRAVVTTTSVDELGLCTGRAAVALVKAPLVGLAGVEEAAPPGVNRLPAAVRQCRRSADAAEVALVLDGGAMLAATVPLVRADALRLRAGERVTAFVDPAHVLIAID